MPANILRFFSLRSLVLAFGGLVVLLALVAGGGIGWLMLFRPLELTAQQRWEQTSENVRSGNRPQYG